MRTLAVPAPRGWCPGALKPMRSGDGLIVRVKPHGGVLSLSAALTLAAAAGAFGNGNLDLTRRANLPIRGVRRRTLPGLKDALARLGLLDASTGVEAIRNVLGAPLAGIDPAAREVGHVVGALERLLAGDSALKRLPPKFCFAIDGGGLLPLDGERADVRLKALPASPAFLLGIDAEGGPHWLGRVGETAAADAAAAAARAFLGVRAERCMRELAPSEREQIRAALMADGALVDASLRSPEPSGEAHGPAAASVGRLELGAGRIAVGVGAPFGRVTGHQLGCLAEAIGRAGGKEVRLSPWRVLFARVRDARSGNRLLGEAADAGFITTPDDPLLRVEACPGKPACTAASLETRTTARRLAACLSAAGFKGVLHVSGCPKGCARSAAAELTMVASGARYLVIPNGTTRSAPVCSVSPQELESDALRALALAGGPNA